MGFPCRAPHDLDHPFGNLLANIDAEGYPDKVSVLKLNSRTLITIVKVPIGVVISALLSYALAKLNMPLRRLILFILIMGLTIPIFIALVPLFALLQQAELTDSL